ncbi:uncharacterized protein FOMMEDRAFT_39636, partial [Fomitiporia mediterranea MF3/22]|uniref:uncharacterized protein n=1 Tax=Fomitiporia mediterranea (strain MF3/22) TaxID=694068 RepID=UPI0004407E1B
QRVRDVVQKIFGYGSNAAHDVLQVGASVLQFAPIGGLAPAAQSLVLIWNALELVESNQMACLSLTERCVDTLIVIREEIGEAGENIEAQLAFPLMQLNESFEAVKRVLMGQVRRRFYKRYLKRKEIQSQVEECDAKLSNALELFSLKIQIRSLQRLEAAEERRR